MQTVDKHKHLMYNIENGGDYLVTVKQAAEIFSVTKRTIFRWIESGQIKAIKIGGTVRIPDEEIERLKRGE